MLRFQNGRAPNRRDWLSKASAKIRDAIHCHQHPTMVYALRTPGGAEWRCLACDEVVVMVQLTLVPVAR